jgi:hypothetical protein
LITKKVSDNEFDDVETEGVKLYVAKTTYQPPEKREEDDK